MAVDKSKVNLESHEVDSGRIDGPGWAGTERPPGGQTVPLS